MSEIDELNLFGFLKAEWSSVALFASLLEFAVVVLPDLFSLCELIA
ncbi:hypothetical protein JJB98_29180 [Bradyrhizobium diazoefficiens]|nr:hypothetical protein [Bradyrhizobium diazoefficiens]QQO23687.1 hypothetical protein JJB98_29180 [Bradyrhizobium diazoefficiens]